MTEDGKVEVANYKPLTNEHAEICLIIFLEYILRNHIIKVIHMLSFGVFVMYCQYVLKIYYTY